MPEGVTVKDIREITGMSGRQFCTRYGIPQRTLENWESGHSTIKPYALKWVYLIVKEDEHGGAFTKYKKAKS